MKVNPAYWESLDEVVASHTILIDRPRGSAHPDFPDMVYPVDYGYLEGTAGMDCEQVDVWIGTTGYAQVEGLMCTVNTDKRDIEIKILYACTAEEMEAIFELMNIGAQMALMIRRADAE